MNERIRELAKESGYVYHVGGTIPYFEFSNNQLEKFAELIVRECARVAFDDWCEGTNESSSEMAIKKHFGVE